MTKLFKITSKNITSDKRERQWVTFILLARFIVTLQKNAVPNIKTFQINKYTPKNTTYFLLSGRLTISHVSMSEDAKKEYGLC